MKHSISLPMRLFMAILSLGLALLLYPIALTLVVVADTLLGDAEFVGQLLYDSKREMATTLVNDWLSALPFAVVLWFVVRGVSKLQQARILMGALFLGSLLLVLLAFIPPYIPLIFGALLLCVALLSFIFNGLLRRVAR